MTESEAKQRIPLYLDGELPPEQRTAFEQALAGSSELQAELQRWRRFNSCLCRCTGGDIDPALLTSLRSRVRSGLAGNAASGHWIIRIGILGAVAAAVALFVWFRPELIDRAQRSVTPNGTATAGLVVAPADLERFWAGCGRGEHREYKFTEDTPAAARAYFQGRQPFRVQTPDLTSRGFVLRGACHCFPGGKGLAAHVFYRNPETGHVISIFSLGCTVNVESVGECAAPCKGLHGYQEGLADGVSIIKWCDGKCSYVAVADLPIADLREIVVAALDAPASNPESHP